MTKMFGNLTNDGLEQAEDRLGGSGFDPIPSGVYDATIKLAYVGKASSSNASSITIVADINGKELRETIWVTDRDGNNFYADKQDPKKKIPLPGFTLINDICLLTTGDDLSEMAFEEKVIKVYDPAERKEVNKPTPVAVDLLNKQIKLGVLRQIVDKQKKDDSGKYVNTGETRTENTIDKAFHAESGRTVNEFIHKVEEAEFMKAWKERNDGKDRNRARGLEGGAGGASGVGRPGAAGGQAKKSLFAK